jgi:hypothetical protein
MKLFKEYRKKWKKKRKGEIKEIWIKYMNRVGKLYDLNTVFNLLWVSVAGIYL